MAADNNGWLDLFSGLPAQAQGAVSFAVALAVGYAAYRKFRSRLFGNEPASTDFAVGDPTTFADMTSVKKLAANVDLLTLQMMKSVIALEETARKMGNICDLVGQMLLDMREQREEQELEDAWQRGHDEGSRARPPRRRPVSKKPPRAG